jgi:hypothetical protein
MNQLTSFSGALTLAPPVLLNARREDQQYLPCPANDLQMLVRSIWARRNRDFDQIEYSQDCFQIEDFWVQHLTGKWKELDDLAATAVDMESAKKVYGEMAACIVSLP